MTRRTLTPQEADSLTVWGDQFSAQASLRGDPGEPHLAFYVKPEAERDPQGVPMIHGRDVQHLRLLLEGARARWDFGGPWISGGAWDQAPLEQFAYTLAGALSSVMLPADQVMPTEKIQEAIHRVTEAGPAPELGDDDDELRQQVEAAGGTEGDYRAVAEFRDLLRTFGRNGGE